MLSIEIPAFRSSLMKFQQKGVPSESSGLKTKNPGKQPGPFVITV